MREKEMGESERKAMARQLEKQGKAVERAAEVEKHLSGQVVRHFAFILCCSIEAIVIILPRRILRR